MILQMKLEDYIPVVHKSGTLAYIKRDGYYPNLRDFRLLTRFEYEQVKDKVNADLGYKGIPIET